MLPTILKGSVRSFLVGLFSLILVACSGDGSLSNDGGNDGGGGSVSGTYSFTATLTDSTGQSSNEVANGEVLTLTVSLTLDGAPVQGQVISVSNSDVLFATLGGTTITTNSNGQATVTLTGTATAGSGTITISNNIESVGDINLPYTSLGDATSTGSYQMVATLTDSDGAVASELAFDEQLTLLVRLTQDGEAVSGRVITFANSNSDFATLSGTTVATDSNGEVRVKLTGKETAGEGTITVSSDISDVSPINLPYSSLGGSSTSNVYTFTAQFTDTNGTVTNQVANEDVLNVNVSLQLDGTPVVGQIISFSNTDTSFASLSGSNVATDASGLVSITLTGLTTAGDGTITIDPNIQGVNPINLPYKSLGGDVVVVPDVTHEVYIIPATTAVADYAAVTASTVTQVTSSMPVTILAKQIATSNVDNVNQLVSFDLSGVQGLVVNASPDKQNGSTLTDANGFATLNLAVGDMSGAGEIKVSFVDGSSVSVYIQSAGRTISGGDDFNYDMFLIPASTDAADYGTITGSLVTTISSAEPAKLLISFTESDGTPISNSLIKISLSEGAEGLAKLNNDLGTVVTDSNGFAALSVVATDVSGAGELVAEFYDGTVKRLAFSSLGDGNQEEPIEIGSLELLADSFQLASSGSDTIELLALVKDPQNNVLPGVQVSFEASSGGIQIESATTDESGVARARLNTLNNPATRAITVSAYVNDQVSTTSISVTGTTVKITGNSSIVTGDSVTMSAVLLDSDGNGIGQRQIELSSSNSNSLTDLNGAALPTLVNSDGDTVSYVTTDSTGNIQFQYTAVASGNDTLNAASLGATSEFSISVSPDSFEIADLMVNGEASTNDEVPLTAGGEFTLTWEKSGTGHVDNVLFSSTRGEIYWDSDDNGSFDAIASTALTTDVDGKVTVKLVSSNAGPAILTAKADGLTATYEFEFVAETAHQIDMQASSFSISPNGQKSTISAVVRDKDGNLVKNRPVNFQLFDVSGGSIFPATDVTDSNGLATTVYTSNAVSANEGVAIAACTDVSGSLSNCLVSRDTGGDENSQNDTFSCEGAECVYDNVKLTVADRELFIAVGTGNTINSATDEEYQKNFSVIVTDADSNPVPNVELSVSALPTHYYEGDWAVLLNEDGDFERYITNVTGMCMNEDIDRDGVLDRLEDIDGDGQLDMFNEDLDNDGRLDLVNEDLDNDGVLDVNEDRDGDGNLDFDEDIDGDGQLDLFYEYVGGVCSLDDPANDDLNGDGTLDVGEDLNCNGILDAGEDVDGDGVLDTTEDLDGDGRLDVSEDLDEDGKLDTTDEDLDGDGNLDTYAFYDSVAMVYGRDLDNSGALEASNSQGMNEINVLEDVDGDGTLDVIEYDYNNDGVYDTDGINEDINQNGILEPGNIVSVIGNLVTDENGTTSVGLRYAESYGGWVRVNLEVKAKVSGTEYRRLVPLLLPVSGDDVTSEDNPPTSNLFGSDGNCYTVD